MLCPDIGPTTPFCMLLDQTIHQWPSVHRQGAYAGFISGLVATMWLGVGAYIYKPDIPRAPVSTAGCDVINSTMWSMSTSSMYDAPTALPDPADA